MVTDDKCPQPGELRQHLLGEISEPRASALDEHLAECLSCSSVVDRSASSDTFVDAVRAAGKGVDRADGPDLERVLERVKALRPQPVAAGEDATIALLRPGTAALQAEAAALPSVPGHHLLEELGRGGMGVVYKARHSQLNRLVALKMILSGEHAGSAAVGRFRAEAEAVAQLQHPNIVQLYEIGEHAGQPYFSLEFVDGGSLADKLDGTPLPPREAAHLVEVLARAMDYAHQRHIIHRDLKPGNVLLSADGTPKIADFGLAKHLQGQGANTQTGAIVGTPSYMAPEQASGKGKHVGPEADVYALGAILYELLTGRPPFKASSPLETLFQVAVDEPVPPTRLQSGVPRDLETICLKCLEKHPARRYRTAAELAEDLRRFQANEPILARPVSTWERSLKWARRRPMVAALLATVVALTATAVVLPTLAWGQAEEAKKQTEEEKKKVEDAFTREAGLRREADDQRRKLQRQSATLLLDRGIALAEQQDACRGLLWMTRALQVAGTEHPDLERVIRQNLASWSSQVHPLRFALLGASEVRTGGPVYSPDGKSFLTWAPNVQHWDAATGKLLATMPYGHKAVYSPDGKKIAVAMLWERAATIWDSGSGKMIGPKLQHEGGSCMDVVFSPDGKLLATSSDWDASVHLWDAATWTAIGKPFKSDLIGGVMVFSPDSRKLLMAHPQCTFTTVCDTEGKRIGKPIEAKPLVGAAAWSPDGKLIAIGQGPVVRLFSSATLEPVGQPLQHNGDVLALAFDRGGEHLLTGSGDQLARLWDLRTRQTVFPPLPHTGPVTQVAFSPDSKRFLTGGGDQKVRLWETNGGRLIGAQLPHQWLVRAAYGPDGNSIATESNKVVRVWDISAASSALPDSVKLDPRTVRHWAGQQRTREGSAFADLYPLKEGIVAAWAPDGKTLATAEHYDPWTYGYTHYKIFLWKVVAGHAPVPVGKPIESKARFEALAFSLDSKSLLSLGETSNTVAGGPLNVWDVATGKGCGKEITLPHSFHRLSAALGADGKTVLETSTGGASLKDIDMESHLPYDAKLGYEGTALSLPKGSVYCGALSPDGKVVVTGAEDGIVRFFEVPTGKALDRTLLHRGAVVALSLSRDGKYVLTGSNDQTARLWHFDTGKPATPPLHQNREVTAVAISPDGKVLLTSSGSRAQLWDATTGEPLGPAMAREEPITAIAFSLDSTTCLVARRGIVELGKVPRPLEGNGHHLQLWAEVLTGLQLDEDGTIGMLDGRTWRERKDRLEKLGGAPGP
jgi:serine/threonine protein kinase/WD40 repeat protein